MKAQDHQITQLLEVSKQFIIPIFQLTYSWEREHWEQLWNDILRVGCNLMRTERRFAGSRYSSFYHPSAEIVMARGDLIQDIS